MSVVPDPGVPTMRNEISEGLARIPPPADVGKSPLPAHLTNDHGEVPWSCWPTPGWSYTSRFVMAEHRSNRVTRRQALRRFAAVGAVAWAVPTVQTVNMTRAFAQTQASDPKVCSWFRISKSDVSPDGGRRLRWRHDLDRHVPFDCRPDRLHTCPRRPVDARGRPCGPCAWVWGTRCRRSPSPTSTVTVGVRRGCRPTRTWVSPR